MESRRKRNSIAAPFLANRTTGRLKQGTFGRRIKRGKRVSAERDPHYRAFFNLAAIGAAQADLKSQRFIDVNEKLCEITGYMRDELLQMTFKKITHPDDRASDFEPLARLTKGEIPSYETEKRLVRKDGRVIWVTLAATVIRGPSGRPLHTASLITDVTERRMAEREREKLIAELQHALSEVRTLSGLLPICAWCKKVRDDKGYWERIESYFETHSHMQFTHGICPDCVQEHHSRSSGVPRRMEH